MDTVVLGWDPSRGSPWQGPYEQCVRRCHDDRGLLERWPVDAWQMVPAGTRVHLMLQGRHRGLVGRGTVRSAPFLSADPTRPGNVAHLVLVEWDVLLPLDRAIPVEALEAAVPHFPWRSSYASAQLLSPEGAGQLDLIWTARSAPIVRRLTRNALRLLRR